MKLSLGFVLVATVAGCGAKNNANPVPADSSGGDSGSGSGTWTSLISRPWSIPPGTFDKYACVRIQVPEDMWVGGFHRDELAATTNMTGTHHQVLTVTDNLMGQAVGEYDCGASSLDQKMLYAAGIGTDDMLFPDGYAVHLAAGTYINLNLHLFNAGDTMLTSTSGISVKKIDAATSPKEIDFEFGGKMQFTIPYTDAATSSPVQIQGSCNVPASGWKIFALWPHMHQLADHQTVTLTHGGTPTTLLDTAYAFAEQKFYPMTVDAVAGDKIGVTCEYYNNKSTHAAGGDVGFGDKSTDEMCFSGFYKYPAGAAGSNLFACALGL